MIVIAQRHKEALARQKQKFLAQSFQVHETAHFVFCRKQSSQHTVLLHAFQQPEIDAELICFIEKELSSSIPISSTREFGAVIFAVLASTFPSPRNQNAIWQRFCVNTLTKLRDQIAFPLFPPPEISYVAPFAAIYRRVFDLSTGQSLLDVGCSFGFLPVLIAERTADAVVIGCDTSPDAISFSTHLANAVGIRNVTFTSQDVLDVAILGLGTFDTVTAIHVLEHMDESDMSAALTHLLNLTSKRLIIAVPFEQHATFVYGHQQVFTPAKLEFWGQWCVKALQGGGYFWREDVAGGMLVVERFSK